MAYYFIYTKFQNEVFMMVDIKIAVILGNGKGID